MDEPPKIPGWIRQTKLLSSRLLRVSGRSPVIALNLILAVFFLLVYDGSLGGARALVRLVGGNYVNFILPAAILAASVAGGASGLLLVEDIKSNYFARQMTMPLRRSALIVSLIAVGALHVVLQTLVVIAIALPLGADPATGVAGLLVIVLVSLLWGLGFAGYSVVVGIVTRDVQMTSVAGLIFVPLIFMSPLLVPRRALMPWVQAAASVNPASYVIDGTRTLLVKGWDTTQVAGAVGASATFAVLALIVAVVMMSRLESHGRASG